MRLPLEYLVATFLLVPAGPAFSAGDESCREVRMADLGWTDIALTNNTAAIMLEALGYEVTQDLLGLNVTYEMLKRGDIDVFLGNWRPVQDEQFAAYFEEGSVVPLTTNLEGAKFTLAVPSYVHEAGVTDFADLDQHGDRFDRKIYAIEPGSNQPLIEMVEVDRHGLGDWEIVESSEAAMLSQVERMVRNDEWVVFLGWQPHPMNVNYDMEYLSGGDIEFGPNFGGATVRTIVGEGYEERCPNVAQLFENLVFDIDYENAGMNLVTNDGMSPREAAHAMMSEHPQKIEAWLEGVTTFDGQPALPAVEAEL